MPPKKSASSSKVTSRQGNLTGFLKKANPNSKQLDSDDEGQGMDIPLNTTKSSKEKPRPDQSDLPPLSDISSMFEDMVNRIAPDFLEVVKQLNGRKLRVATMCSGTESPLLALGLISRALKKSHGVEFEVEHVFSCEIVPWKQAYIERNFQPPILFRDICELAGDYATTAYGAQVEVPGNIDMLIAGTSCVDYSTLNNNKQDIDAKGESGQTFRGMMGWVRRHQPPIVILENICSAPWDRVKGFFEKEDYSAEWARFDTKHYYIPHTRTRVYLYAIRGAKSKAPQKWKERVKALERPCSAPYDAFLLATDDPRIQLGREKLIKEENSRHRAHEWAKCETRHARARMEAQLGSRRPLTNWNENGMCKMLDFAWIDWANSQVDRVWDLLDISFLRKAAEGTDATYKSILWNLSQNVDRQIGSSVEGVCPCLTPTMIPYLNFRGGPMIGLEALSLQGLPVDELILTRETEDNLADLAGNAMSSTVVGAVMLTSMILSKACLTPGTQKKPIEPAPKDAMDVDEGLSEKLPPDTKIGGDHQLTEKPFDLTATSDSLTLMELLKLAQDSARLCTCEGRGGMTAVSVTRCQDCNFTACVRCGGRPEHNYVTIDTTVHARLSPLTFEKHAKNFLPMCLQINGLNLALLDSIKESVSFSSSIPRSSWAAYVKAVEAAVSQEFRYHNIKRQATWVAVFDSPTAYLEFEMDPKAPEWCLFAKPDPSEPTNSPVRVLLSRAVARLKVHETLLEGTWELSVPASAKVDITLEGVVDASAEEGGLVPSWESRLGLERPNLREKKVWEKMELSMRGEDRAWFDDDITGVYRWLPNCAAANASLHILERPTSTKPPVFFFLDPTKYAKNDSDSFVFSKTFRRFEYGESRPTIASLETRWRQSAFSGKSNVECLVDHRWVPAPGVSLETASSRDAYFAIPGKELVFEVAEESCGIAQAVLTAKVHLGSDAPPVWSRRGWTEVDKIHERLTFQSIAFLLERLRDVPNQGEWVNTCLATEHNHLRCETCAPTAPRLLWEKSKGRASAYEDPEQAGEFERSLKRRPSPFVTQLALDTQGYGHVRIGCNIPSLTHRAISRLPSVNRPEPVSTSYRITTDYMPPAKLFRPKFKLMSNRHDPQHAQPPNFRKKMPLRKEQLRSLDWMLRQEAEDVPEFEEEEIAEAILQPLGWRAEAKASRHIRVRGGVLADEVGYGKTAITLGLISCATSSRPYVEPSQEQRKGLISTKASLIIVPPHLTRQWDSEIKKFTSSAFTVEVIATTTQLNSITIEKIQDADIVIVASNLFNSTAYLDNFESFAGQGELPATFGRYWRDRHNLSIKGLRQQAVRLQDEGASAVMEKIIEGSKIDTSLEDQAVRSKRLRGAQYRAAQEHVASRAQAPPTAPSGTSKERRFMRDVYIDVRLSDLTATPPSNTPIEVSDDDERPQRSAKGKSAIIVEDSESNESEPSSRPMSRKVGTTTDDDDFQEVEEVDSDEESPKPDYVSSESEGSSDSDPPPKRKQSMKQAAQPEAKNRRKRKSSADSDEDEDSKPVSKKAAPPKKKQKVEGPPKKKRFESDPWKLLSSPVKRDFTEMSCPPLELFFWNRVVIDEYTYLQDKAHAMITALEATHRWVLSGTPPIHDFASVKTIAVFLGLHLGVDDDDEGPTSSRKGDKTSVEQFHSFREVRSVDWYLHRYEVGQRFLDQYVRQNIAEIDEIHAEERPEVIQLPAAERALERELDHTLRAQEMNTKRNRKTKSDRDRRITKSLKESSSAEEALLKCVAFYDNIQSGSDNAMKACDYVVKVRKEDLEECKGEIRTVLAKLEAQRRKLSGVDGETHYQEWLRVTKDTGVGDGDATDIVLELHRMAESSSGGKGRVKAKAQDDDELSEDNSKVKAKKKPTKDGKNADAIWEHRETTHELRLLIKELVGRVRSLRYFEAVRLVQREHGATESVFRADCGGGCGRIDLRDSELCLLSSCGHMACSECIHKAALEEKCVLGSKRCQAQVRLLNIVRADSLGTDDEIKDAKRHFGKKLEEVIDMIKNRIPKRERVLLFVQFRDLMAKVGEALKANKVTYLEIQGTATQKSKNLERFQDPDADEKVLLLGLEDESASGANLTVANHIIFLSPMWPKSKEQYVATETQAIGRARRYGQTKKVHIWRFVARDTIDVEVYERFGGVNYQALADEKKLQQATAPPLSTSEPQNPNLKRASGSMAVDQAPTSDYETDPAGSSPEDRLSPSPSIVEADMEVDSAAIPLSQLSVSQPKKGVLDEMMGVDEEMEVVEDPDATMGVDEPTDLTGPSGTLIATEPVKS